MSIEMFFRQSARIERSVAAVSADGTVLDSWEIVLESAPCLLEKVTTADGSTCGARCYFPGATAGLAPDSGGRRLRILVGDVVFQVRGIYRVGAGSGVKMGILVAELES